MLSALNGAIWMASTRMNPLPISLQANIPKIYIFSEDRLVRHGRQRMDQKRYYYHFLELES